MTSNLAINDTLLNAAFELGGYSSKKESVNTALQEFIQRRKSEELMQLFGTIEYDADYDYKKLQAREKMKLS
ncbi:MAG: type II toxin-antitoxin system VapB family antitoxin [Spirochaetaceae bacterium]|nr:type II toxin-antitoxin system VapB family antitoxin [Spirochaetaceae bacterium]